MTLESVGEFASRAVANRYPRKTFLGKLAGATVAFGAGSALYSTDARADHQLPCGCASCGNSVSCSYFGASGSSCPAGTCACGFWYVCSGCSGRYKKIEDCCASCTDGCRCSSTGFPICCYSAPYGSCSGWDHVKCRLMYCSAVNC